MTIKDVVLRIRNALSSKPAAQAMSSAEGLPARDRPAITEDGRGSTETSSRHIVSKGVGKNFASSLVGEASGDGRAALVESLQSLLDLVEKARPQDEAALTSKINSLLQHPEMTPAGRIFLTSLSERLRERNTTDRQMTAGR